MLNLTIVLSNFDPSGIECSNILLWRAMCTLRADIVRMASSSNDLQLPGIPSEIQYLLSFQCILILQSHLRCRATCIWIWGLNDQFLLALARICKLRYETKCFGTEELRATVTTLTVSGYGVPSIGNQAKSREQKLANNPIPGLPLPAL